MKNTKSEPKVSHDIGRDRERWWLEPESNWRHKDFQSSALPTELSSQRLPVLKFDSGDLARDFIKIKTLMLQNIS